jgi:anti-sigma factor RsiW
MKTYCDLFNRYRDGMLDSKQAIQFESHVAACDQCRPRLFLLNNMVHAFSNQDIPVSKVPHGAIAARAFEQCGSLDVFLLSWLKPLPAWAGLAVFLVLATFLWVAPSVQQQPPGDYEDLITSGDQSRSLVNDLSDDKLESWLEQGGSLQ